MSIQWRILVVEDNEEIAMQILEGAAFFADEPNSVQIERRANFKEALRLLSREMFDVLILDLQDDKNTALGSEDTSAGLAIFEELKKLRFAPVVFYTAHAHKVRDLENGFVKVVEKSQGFELLIAAVRAVIETKLPELARHIDNVQREYMWEFVSTHWTKFESAHQRVDLAYLMAGRLASTLRMNARFLASKVAGIDTADETEYVHAMQMYVYPTLERLQAGDIVEGDAELPGVWIVLTPTCDLVQKKADDVLLAQCQPLRTTPEYKGWLPSKSGENLKLLQNLIGDNRQGSQKTGKFQADRYKFLPGTFFFDDNVVDFQKICVVSNARALTFKRVATLDSPYAEALLARFTRYFGRLGTPDVDKAAVIKRLEAIVESERVQEQSHIEPAIRTLENTGLDEASRSVPIASEGESVPAASPPTTNPT